ncbi:Mitochondrial distribution and morphology protein 31, mitochondrial precursor [Polyrhizophydium stewartii]|uniref:Mitochondrial distribution and morphology protein 31, mitochondrial n=1 Tax=Polyrhizophydium stewartii TaxID=2732419 RepID=A0ABR4N478_9FUNG|nr:Mitochondrial distribution and morphology protein 31, mitochondrial precursor [Polyrhizophydium stewartii]
MQHDPRISPKEAEKAFRLARQALINNVDGVLPRTMLRIRLFLMGQVRPMKMDDVVALFSWIFVGNTLFVLARTTAFVSVVLVILNYLNFQDKVMRLLSDYLTRATGFNIKVGSAVVPHWRDGTICLENVSVLLNGDTWTEIVRKQKLAKGLGDLVPGEVDVNWTYWDLTMDSIEITLSLWRLLDGRGPIKAAKIKGVRGMVDRRHIQFDPDWVPTRRAPEFGDFEMDSFVVEDLLVTVCNQDFRPYSISIFGAELPLFRKQWLLYDIMCADSIVGMFDNCLFSVHRSQSLDVFRDSPGNYAKVSHLKMNALPIDHLKLGATGPITWLTRGTVDLDLHLLIPRQPNEDDVFDKLLDELDGIREVAIDKLEGAISGPADRRGAAVKGVESDSLLSKLRLPGLKGVRHYGTQYSLRDADKGELPARGPSPDGADRGPMGEQGFEEQEDELASAVSRHHEHAHPPSQAHRDVVIHWRVKLNDLKASVPILNPHLSYMSNALIRPVVAYMNANRTSLPLASSAKMDVNNFNGAWDIYAAGLVDVLSEETGRALVRVVTDERERARQLKRIGLWSVQAMSRSLVALSEYVRGTKSPWIPAAAV